jgi:tyrosine-protein phosphatase YwqE
VRSKISGKFNNHIHVQADDKKLALEETKNYATQALASVAYQINAFSYHLMQLFDHQEIQVSEMQGQVRHINQVSHCSPLLSVHLCHKWSIFFS